MVRNKLFLTAAAIGAFAVAAPASAGGWHHTHSPGCGHSGSSSGGWSSSGGHTPPTGSSSSSSSSGGTAVPEPGMLGMFGAGIAGVGFARSRRRKRK